MRPWLLLAPLLLLLPLAGIAETGEYEEGFNYVRVSPPANTHVAEGKVEVVELFWYGCPHCYTFEPHVTEWLKNKPEAAQFVRMPAVLNPHWEPHARAFYAAELLGVGEELHAKLFDEIHKNKRRLRSEDEIVRFYVQNGVDEAKFREAYGSFAVQTKVRQAARLGRQYQATGVPTVIVNGKYRTNATMAGGYRQMIDIINLLVAQESAAQQASKK